jgi:hypothetical protein
MMQNRRNFIRTAFVGFLGLAVLRPALAAVEPAEKYAPRPILHLQPDNTDGGYARCTYTFDAKIQSTSNRAWVTCQTCLDRQRTIDEYTRQWPWAPGGKYYVEETV